jgi:hypothetical protein
MYRIFLISLVLFSINAKAAFEKVESGAFSVSMGNALVAVPSTINAVFYNPAALDTFSNITAGLSFRNFYGLPEVQQVDLAVNFPLFGQPVAMGINSYGNSVYHEFQIFFAGLIPIYSNLQFGISFQSYFLSIKGYGADNSYGLNLGMLYTMSKQISCAAVMYNINQPVIGQSGEYLPQGFSLGFAYYPESQIILAVEIFKDIRYAPDYRMGISYKFNLPLFVRIGIQDTANCYCVGLGTVFSAFKLDYAFQIQQILGVSHIFSISFTL